MLPLNQLSLRVKLILSILLITALALAGGFYIIISQNIETARQNLVSETEAKAIILSDYMCTALSADQGAQHKPFIKILNELPSVTNACFYRADGSVLTYHSGTNENFKFPSYQDHKSVRFDSRYLHFYYPVHEDGKNCGALYLVVSTSPLIRESRSSILLAAGISLLVLCIAFLLAIWLYRLISKPILELADFSREISQRGDYSPRLKPVTHDEFGLLYQRFNAMLNQIQIHDNKKQKTESALRESESKYRVLIEQIPMVTYAASLNEASTLLFVSPQVKSLLGYSPEEFTSESEIYIKALHPEDYNIAMSKFTHPLDSNKPFIAEYRMYKSDGTIVWIHDEGTVVEDDSGNPLVLQGVMSDITIRKEAEETLKSTRNYLKDVFDSLQSMLVSISPEGIITHWNKAAAEYTGISVDDALGKKIWETGPLMRRYQSNIIHVLQTQTPLELSKEEYVAKDRQFLNISIYPLTYHGGGAVIRIDDVTELQKKDAQLRQAQRLEMVGTLAGGLAHDFNNVLSGIIGSTSLMRFLVESEQIDKDRFKSNLATIETAANRAADMVQQLVGIGKKRELSFSPVDLNQAVRHVVKICKTSFDKSIEINAIFFPKPAMVKADMAQIEQALLNLCVNASHAMTIMRPDYQQQGGILTIAVEKIYIDQHFTASHPGVSEGDHWILRVIDTGVGMDAKTVAKIFDPFFTTKDKSQGTGLGLAMVYNIIHQHQGYIDVYSNPGVGTTFNILLQVLADSPDVVKTRNIEEEMPRGSGTILVVDDEEIVRETARGILELCGYDVILAENGTTGIQFFSEHHEKIEAVLLDMAMPKMSGKETYLELKKIQPDLKVVLASGFKQDRRVQEAIDLGVNDFIQKPYSMLDLAKKIKSVINGFAE